MMWLETKTAPLWTPGGKQVEIVVNVNANKSGTFWEMLLCYEEAFLTFISWYSSYTLLLREMFKRNYEMIIHYKIYF